MLTLTGHFVKITKKQSREMLQRFLAELEPGLSWLQKEVTESGASVPWDYSPESLIPLWEFFIRHLGTVPLGDDELAAVPELLRSDVLPVTFDLSTKLRIVRTGFYLAQVMCAERPSVAWGIGRAQNKNRPVLIGFAQGREFNPVNLVEVQAWRAVSGRSSPTALYDVFRVWLALALPSR